MALKQRVLRLERQVDVWHCRFLAELPPEDYVLEFVRALGPEIGVVSVESVTAHIVSVGGDMEYWRPYIERVLGDPNYGVEETEQ